MSLHRLSAQPRGPARLCQSMWGCVHALLPPRLPRLSAGAPQTRHPLPCLTAWEGGAAISGAGGWAAPGHSPLAPSHLPGSAPAAAQMSGTGNAWHCQHSRPGWHCVAGTQWHWPGTVALAHGMCEWHGCGVVDA